MQVLCFVLSKCSWLLSAAPIFGATFRQGSSHSLRQSRSTWTTTVVPSQQWQGTSGGSARPSQSIRSGNLGHSDAVQSAIAIGPFKIFHASRTLPGFYVLWLLHTPSFCYAFRSLGCAATCFSSWLEMLHHVSSCHYDWRFSRHDHDPSMA